MLNRFFSAALVAAALAAPAQAQDRRVPSSAAELRLSYAPIVQRAQPPMRGVFTLPGGVVEAGETLHQALVREIDEEVGMAIEPVALAGHREVIAGDAEGRAERHFIILAFVARWISGEPKLNHELADARWFDRPTRPRSW